MIKVLKKYLLCIRDIVQLNPSGGNLNKEICTKARPQPMSYNPICKNFRDQVRIQQTLETRLEYNKL